MATGSALVMTAATATSAMFPLRMAHLTVVNARRRIVRFVRSGIVNADAPVTDLDAVSLHVGNAGILNTLEVHEAEAARATGL